MIVVTPHWKRPEFTKVWLEITAKANRAYDMLYVFCLDYGYDKKVKDIIESQCKFKYAIIEMPKTSYKLGKQSYNVLNGMIAAANRTDRYVFYVEEDIFIAKDFFDMHLKIHEKEPDIFCSIATRNNNTRFNTTNELGAYYLSDRPDYQSWGSCFKKDMILNYINPHFVEDYFKDPNRYCKEVFGNSIIGSRFTEQDGLIRRILEKTDLKVAFPHVPRAFHGGFYGYNRPNGVANKPMYERESILRRCLTDAGEMKKYCLRGYYEDSEPVDLETDYKGEYEPKKTL